MSANMELIFYDYCEIVNFMMSWAYQQRVVFSHDYKTIIDFDVMNL